MNTAISIMSIQQLFTAARTHHAWQDRDIADGLLHEIYDLAKWGQHSTMPRWIRPFLKTPHGSRTFFATSATGMLQSFTRAVRALVLIKPASLPKELDPPGDARSRSGDCSDYLADRNLPATPHPQVFADYPDPVFGILRWVFPVGRTIL
jgi:hypothetical protein